jgi:hypothetical protein
MPQKKTIKNHWQAASKRGIKILAELARLLKHQNGPAKAWEGRLITIAAYILPEEWAGDLQETLHELVGWTKILIAVRHICLLVIALMRIKFQDLVSPEADGTQLALEGMRVSDIYLEPAKRILKNFRVSNIEKEKFCAQLRTLSLTLDAKDPSEFGEAERTMVYTILGAGLARMKKSTEAIHTADRAAHALGDKMLPLTRFTPDELKDLYEFMTGLTYSINQAAQQSRELSAELTGTLEGFRSRWPTLFRER